MRCYICPIHCENVGFCGGFFYDGNTWRRIYHNVEILNVTIEKVGFYHFYPGEESLLIISSGCNLPCIFCPKHEVVFERKFALPLDKVYGMILSEIYDKNPKIVGFYCNSILDIEIIRMLRKSFWGKIVVRSNGFLSERSINSLLDEIDGIIIRFLGFSDTSYCRLSVHPNGYKYALETLRRASAKNIHVELEFYIVPGITSHNEFVDFISIIAEMNKNIPLHLKRFYPNFLEKSRSPTRTELLMRYFRLAKEKIRYVYADLWYPSTNDTYCPNNHRVIKRLGWKVMEKKLVGNRCRICGFQLPLVLD